MRGGAKKSNGSNPMFIIKANNLIIIHWSVFCVIITTPKSHVNGCDDYGCCPTSHITSILHVSNAWQQQQNNNTRFLQRFLKIFKKYILIPPPSPYPVIGGSKYVFGPPPTLTEDLFDLFSGPFFQKVDGFWEKILKINVF